MTLLSIELYVVCRSPITITLSDHIYGNILYILLKMYTKPLIMYKTILQHNIQENTFQNIILGISDGFYYFSILQYIHMLIKY